MLFNLYVGNHGKKAGIEDYVSVITDLLKKRGHQVMVSEEFRSDANNLVIDEFTNFVANMELREFRHNNPQAKITYVLTEFVERRKLVRSFNFFGGWLEASVIAAMTVFFRRLRKDYLPASMRDWIVAILYLPLLAIFYAAFSVRNLISKHRTTFSSKVHAKAYLLVRYLGLEAHLRFADYVILSHPLIGEQLQGLRGYDNWHGKILGTLYPELDIADIEANIFRDKGLFVEATGTITPYRNRILRMINYEIISLGLGNTIDLCQARSFSSHGEARQGGAYSIHPPQSESWSYCSPTRLYRALQVDHNAPIITKDFGQHPIEKVCLMFGRSETVIKLIKYFKKPDTYLADFKPRFEEYNRLATANNDQLLESFPR